MTGDLSVVYVPSTSHRHIEDQWTPLFLNCQSCIRVFSCHVLHVPHVAMVLYLLACHHGFTRILMLSWFYTFLMLPWFYTYSHVVMVLHVFLVICFTLCP